MAVRAFVTAIHTSKLSGLIRRAFGLKMNDSEIDEETDNGPLLSPELVAGPATLASVGAVLRRRRRFAAFGRN